MPAYIETAIRDIDGRGDPIGRLDPDNGIALWFNEEELKVKVVRPNGAEIPPDAPIHVFGAADGLIYILPSGTGVTSLRHIPENNPHCVEGYHPRFGTLKAWSRPSDGNTPDDYKPITWLDIAGVATIEIS